MMNHMSASDILAKIGNVVASAEVDGVLFTLAADAALRVNDLDSGLLVSLVRYRSQASAESGYAALVEKARKMAA